MTHFSTRKVALKTLQATMMVAALLLSATNAFAQRIQVLDTDGQPVPFVSVTDARGHYIGSTDLDGWLDDTKGNTTLNLSQVAYKPKTVDVSLLTDGKIILEDAALNLPEVVVKPKGLIYVQTYFRVVYIDEDGPIYYRGGLIDNSYDIEKKKVSAKNHHMSKGESGFIRFLLDRFAGQFDDFCKLPDRSHYQVMLRQQEKGNLTFSDTVNGRQIVSDSICPLGFVDWDKENGLRSASFSWRKFFAHKEAAEKLAKAQEKGKEVAPKDTAIDTRVNDTFFEVYRTNAQGVERVEDFVMAQLTREGTHKHSGKHFVILAQTYAVECCYADKKELKQLRKDNKIDMNYDELVRFEQTHSIPPLPPNLQTEVNKLFVKKK